MGAECAAESQAAYPSAQCPSAAPIARRYWAPRSRSSGRRSGPWRKLAAVSASPRANPPWAHAMTASLIAWRSAERRRAQRGRPFRRRAEAHLHLGELARQVGMIGQDAAKVSARGRAVAGVDREVHQMVVDRREGAVERDHPLERGPRVLRGGAGEAGVVDQRFAEAQPAVHVVAIVQHRALVGGDGAVTVAQDQIALRAEELRPARRHPVRAA